MRIMLIAMLLVTPIRAASPTRDVDEQPTGTIAFASLAPRGWDVYVDNLATGETQRVTDHPALEFNAAIAPDGARIAFVSERDGNQELYVLDLDGSQPRRLTAEFALDDHPAWAPDGDRLAFCSTREPAEQPGQAWNAVYVMNADGSKVQRLTPASETDYSPAWSPTGDAIAVASGSGVAGGTDLYVMAPDGSNRRLVIENGGWPTFAGDGQSLFFHRRHEGSWGIWRVGLDGSNLKRITTNEIEAMTPRACSDGRWLAVTVRESSNRQVARIDLDSGALEIVTDEPTDHWNPSISKDGQLLTYHRISPDATTPNVEAWGTPEGTAIQMLRVAGSFPTFSPTHDRLALTGGSFARVDVMNLDGSERRTAFEGEHRSVFSLSWSKPDDLIAFSQGRAFSEETDRVEIAVVRPDGSGHRTLTDNPANDAFPAFSPDGSQIVFRSGRDGSKNLYIMDRDGSNVRRLTEGNWTDTMPKWSPSGDWIVFASNRDEDFEIWVVRPDGRDLRKVIGGGGRHNHPHFSEDERWIVFTSQRAGVSAETIALPSQPQPYGSLFAVRSDGSDLIRLTHNGFEEGTPAWGPALEVRLSTTGDGGGDEY